MKIIYLIISILTIKLIKCLLYLFWVFLKKIWMGSRKKIMEHLFVDSINAIISIFPNIKIIFKPYSMTNIDTLHKLIKFTNCSNYEISYLHPFVLSKNVSLLLQIVALLFWLISR